MLDLGWLSQDVRVGVGQGDARVTALQQQISSLLTKLGAPAVPTSGQLDPSTCAGLSTLVQQSGAVPWITRVTSTMTTKVIQDPAVFAAAVAACSQWPPKTTQPPVGFPHTHQVASGDTLAKIATQLRRHFWQELRTANPFLGQIGENAPLPANVLWLPLKWPSGVGGTAPSTIRLPMKKQLTAIPQGEPRNIPGIPFLVPQFPVGVDPTISLQAIAALQKAATACPSIAVPNGPLQHAAMAFATFAAVSVALQGTGAESLATLEEQLDAMCPAWRNAVPGQPPATPPSPPPAHPLSGLLNQLVLLLGAAASTGDLSQLPALAQQASGMGLPKTSAQITRLVENPPVAPEDKAPPQDEGAPAKKGMGAAVIAVVLIAGTVLFFAVK